MSRAILSPVLSFLGAAGGAILGDGRVGLILDMDGLFGGSSNG